MHIYVLDHTLEAVDEILANKIESCVILSTPLFEKLMHEAEYNTQLAGRAYMQHYVLKVEEITVGAEEYARVVKENKELTEKLKSVKEPDAIPQDK